MIILFIIAIMSEQSYSMNRSKKIRKTPWSLFWLICCLIFSVLSLNGWQEDILFVSKLYSVDEIIVLKQLKQIHKHSVRRIYGNYYRICEFHTRALTVIIYHHKVATLSLPLSLLPTFFHVSLSFQHDEDTRIRLSVCMYLSASIL